MSVFYIYYEDSRTPENVREMIAAVIDALSISRSQMFNVAEATPESISVFAPAGSTWILHNTATYFPAFTKRILERIKSLTPSGPIIVMKQDDHLAPRDFDNLFVKFGVTSVMTYLDESQVALVYPNAKLNGVTFFRVNVGYLSRQLLRARPKPLGNILKGSYRGSLQPFSLGRLGFDKGVLPGRIQAQSRDAGLKGWVFDVSSRWQDRLYGRAWYDFLNNARVIFTTESGSNSFDLDGSLRRQTEAFEEINGKLSWEDMDLVHKYFDEVQIDFEGNVQGGTFSPRNLEAGVLARPQVAIHGDYSGFFEGFERQFFVERDLSNLSDVLEQYSDVALATNIANEFRESLLSRDNLRLEDLKASVFRCVEQAQDSTISQSIFNIDGMEKGVEEAKVLILSPSPREADPRTEWWAQVLKGFQTNCDVLEWLGDQDPKLGWRVWGLPSGSATKGTDAGFFEVANPALLTLVREICKYPDHHVSWRAQRILDMFLALAPISGNFRPNGIVACDLESAVIANILWGDSAIVLYDAQEMPAEQLDGASDVARALFCMLERFTIRESALTVTVSPGAAEYFGEAYGITPHIVPNFLPQDLGSDVDSQVGPASGRGKIVRFVFYGRFSPGRALPEMIKNWPGDPKRRELHIYAVGLRERNRKKLERAGVFIHRPVSPEGLRNHLRDFDVGLIPYDYGYPYNHASPNKFGQYLDAGLAIVSSDTPFVGDLVAKFELGEVFSWRDPKSYPQAIENMTARIEVDSDETRQLIEVAKKTLNWEAFAKPVVSDFVDLMFSRLADKQSSERDFVPGTVLSSTEKSSRNLRRGLKSIYVFLASTPFALRALRWMVLRPLRVRLLSYLNQPDKNLSGKLEAWKIPV